MNDLNRCESDNAYYEERYELISDRIRLIKNETDDMFFCTLANKAEKLYEVFNLVKTGSITDMTSDHLRAINDEIYADIKDYGTCCGNPDFMSSRYKKETGQLLSALYYYVTKEMIKGAFLGNLPILTRASELFGQIYFEMSRKDGDNAKILHNAIYSHISDYSDEVYRQFMRESFEPEYPGVRTIIENAVPGDLRYLYYFGLNVSGNEIKTAEYLSSLSSEKIDDMARTYTGGYRRGFIAGGMDMSKKSTAEIRYHIGFERLVKAAMEQFKDMGLDCIIRYSGLSSTPVSRQYDYDHRHDIEYFYDKALIDRRTDALKAEFARFEKSADAMAGPAVIDTFGEIPFEPHECMSALKLNPEKEKLAADFRSRYMREYNRYVRGDETSFTIIAYPLPSIGEKFEEIFEKIIEINNLDSDLYSHIQETIIDILDECEYVHVVGTNGNKTDIRVKLWEPEDREKQTLFENCVADVNIPVGEIFTSPVLEGTNGILNVSGVYLNGLKYNDLTLVFEDGMIKSYDCRNFDDDEKNRRFIRENLLMNRETLPLGEFAIGTNTTAYVSANMYGMADRLPILIAEKMGPHFAVGDTCYKYSEDMHVYNPNGKEIVAKENSISKKRGENPKEAYFNCHTDITIPYDEIGKISGIKADGEEIYIIKNGRFVPEGCRELNVPFESAAGFKRQIL